MKEKNNETEIDTSTEEYKPRQLGSGINRTECIALHKNLHAISVDHLTELKKLPLGELQAQFGLVQSYLADKLFQKCGIESEELDGATETLGLEQDPEYMGMVQEYQMKVAGLKLG